MASTTKKGTYESKTVAQLRAFLHERELEKSGSRDQLIARLVEFDNVKEEIGSYFTNRYEEGERIQVPELNIDEISSRRPWIDWMIRRGRECSPKLDLEPTGFAGAPQKKIEGDLRITIRKNADDYLFKVFLQYELERMMNGNRSVRILSADNRRTEDEAFKEIFRKICEGVRNDIMDFFNAGRTWLHIDPTLDMIVASEESPICNSQGNPNYVNLKVKHLRLMIDYVDNSGGGEEGPGFYQRISERAVTLLFQESRPVVIGGEIKTYSMIERNFYTGLSDYLESLLERSYDDIKKSPDVKNERWQKEILEEDEEHVRNSLRRSSQILSLVVLSILDSDDWIRRRSGRFEDKARHYDKDILERRRGKKPAPNMLDFSEKLTEILGESRDHPWDHPIFRVLERYPKRWMNCLPEDHRIKSLPNEKWKERIPHGGGYLIPRPQSPLRFTVSGGRKFEKSLGEEEVPENLRTRLNYQKAEKAVEALNILQSTQWEVNLDLLEEIARFEDTDGNEIEELRGKTTKLNKITILDECRDAFYFSEDEDSPNSNTYENKEREKRLSHIIKILDNNANVFWHSWSFDWRGRLVVKAPLLSPQQSDIDRALIRFKHWKPLGEEGWRAFRLFFFGFFAGNEDEIFDRSDLPKKSLRIEERIDWVQRNIESGLILKISRDWKSYLKELGLNERPQPKSEVFQRLAALLEIRRLWSVFQETNDWDLVKSGNPVHFDASASGYQHLSALFRNKKLAELVNVIKNDEGGKRDIYVDVARKCEERWEKEGKEGSKLRSFLESIDVSDELLEKIREGVFNRKMSKQPTMTMIYGAKDLEKCFSGRKGRGKPGWEIKGGKWYIRWHDESPLMPLFESLHLTDPGGLFHNSAFDEDKGKTMQKMVSMALKEDYEWAVGEVTDGSFDDLTKQLGTLCNDAGDPICWRLPDGLEINYQYREKAKDDTKAWEFLRNNPLLRGLVIVDGQKRELLSGKDKSKCTYRGMIGLIHDRDDPVNGSDIKIDDHFVEDAIEGFGKVGFREKVINKMYEKKGWKDKYYKSLDIDELERRIGELESNPVTIKKKTKLVDKLVKLEKENGRHNFWEVLEWNERKKGRGAHDLSRAIYLHIRDRIKQKGEEKSTNFENQWMISASVVISAPYNKYSGKPDKNKTKSSFAPNFIHSLDGTHMRASIVELKRRVCDASIWSVHDSFGCHACDIPSLVEIVKSEFVKLHYGGMEDWSTGIKSGDWGWQSKNSDRKKGVQSFMHFDEGPLEISDFFLS